MFRGPRNGARPTLAGIHKWRRSRGNNPLAKRKKLHAKSDSRRYVSRLGKRCLGNRTAYRKDLWSDCITIGRAVLLLCDFARPWRALFFIKPLPSLCPDTCFATGQNLMVFCGFSTVYGQCVCAKRVVARVSPKKRCNAGLRVFVHMECHFSQGPVRGNSKAFESVRTP